jgi:hypothetical protein
VGEPRHTSMTTRKPRPLARDKEVLRDTRLFIIACDDTFAPQQYFSFFRIPRVKLHVVPTEDGTSVARQVLERLLKFEHEADDELWMLLDTDHCTRGTHLGGFTEALQRARKQDVHIALSKPCFEFWLLLHHDDEAQMANLSSCTEVEARLRSILGEYNKTRLKAGHYPAGAVATACERHDRSMPQLRAAKYPPRTRAGSTGFGSQSLLKRLPQKCRRTCAPCCREAS